MGRESGALRDRRPPNAQIMTFSVDDGVLTLAFGEGGPMTGATATLRPPGSGQ